MNFLEVYSNISAWPIFNTDTKSIYPSIKINVPLQFAAPRFLSDIVSVLQVFRLFGLYKYGLSIICYFVLVYQDFTCV